MKSKYAIQSWYGAPLLPLLVIAISFVLSGCASTPSEESASLPEVVEVLPKPSPMPPLNYYQLLSRMTPAELSRERMVLAALPRSPNTQLRLAMLLGYPRAQQDIARAMSQLDSILKSNDPAAIALHSLARLLADNYAERQRMDAHLERQGQQLKDSLRKGIELQEKIDELADIERTLPQRPPAVRPAGSGRAR